MKAVVNAIERELIEEAYPIIMKSPVGKQPRTGVQADDDGERCKRREKPEETALRRQTRKGRTQEGGTQGGKTADVDPPGD